MRMRTFVRKFVSRLSRSRDRHPAGRWKKGQKTFLPDLPNEIIHMILEYLNEGDKYHLGRTGTYLSALAIPSIYDSCTLDFVKIDDTDEWVVRVPFLPDMPKLQAYLKYGKSVRNVFLANLFGGGISDVRAAETSLSHMNLLLPHFTNLRSFAIQRMNGTGPPLTTYICALRQALRTCLSLNEVFIMINYDIGDLAAISVLEDRFALESPAPHPHLRDLTVRLGQMAYNGDLAPTYSLLNLLCKMIGDSSLTVQDFKFGVVVPSLHRDFDENLYEQSNWALISRDESSKPVMNLPMVSRVLLDFTEAPLCQNLFLDFCNVDMDEIRTLELWHMSATESYTTEQGVEFFSMFSNVQLIMFVDAIDSQWVDVIFEARDMGELKWLKELRVYFQGVEPPADGSHYRIAESYSSKCKWYDIVKCVDQSADHDDKVAWMVLFGF
ncbi:hypothetical protein TWF506_003381 [Arthrobotrys conoides]|uniref:F-box domain-containing protein n=1 Tax=Arthrobotrys conoides TaxID=74498 RepID=A0AAN8RQ83_9PEZI